MAYVYEEITENKIKSWLLIFLFFVIIIALGYVFGLFFGSLLFGLSLAIIISIIITLISYFSGDKIILQMSRAKPVDRKKYPHLVNTVEGLAIASGIKAPKIYIIEDTAMNAFATGRNPDNAAITVTSGLVEKLNRQELEGVIAHEMSHIKNYDIRLMMLVVILVGVIALISDLFLRGLFYGKSDESRGKYALPFLIFGIIMIILAPIIAQLIKFSVSRQREFLADADGALLTRYPKGLASALRKLAKDKEILEAANKATAHLYIVNPLKNANDYVSKLMSTLFSTHPNIEDRIKRLEGM